MKGLLIAEPWISCILSGRKTWEMRSQACRYRGPIALIRSGSGSVVGIADVVDSLASLDTPEAYAAGERYHAIEPERQAAAFEAGWRTPWVFSNVRPLTNPVPYKHPSGAVSWVNLDDEVAATVRARAKGSRPRTEPAHVEVNSHAAPVPHSSHAGLRRIVRLTGGNLRNNHIYLPLDFFPDDAIGGANRNDAAPRTITVTFSPGDTIETDIDRTKRILRARGAVREFLARAGMEEGDAVLIERTASHSFVFSKASQ